MLNRNNLKAAHFIANKIDIILKSIDHKCGNDIYNDLIAKVGMIGEKATLKKQVKYMKSLLEDETLDGKEVYLVTFKSKGEPTIGNVQKLVDIKNNKIVGTAFRD